MKKKQAQSQRLSAEKKKEFVERLVHSGRLKKHSKVVRESLRRMEDTEHSYLLPPPLTPTQIKTIYGRASTVEDDHECAFGQAAFAANRRAACEGNVGAPSDFPSGKSLPRDCGGA